MRTILADREPTVRNALRALTTQGLGMEVVGEADTAPALQRQVELQHPDLVIVAWNLIVTHAAPVLTTLRSSASSLRIVVLGLRPETREAALAAGADGYVCMVDAPDVVARVLQPTGTPDTSTVTDTDRRHSSGWDDETYEPGGHS
jgi:DNA-binding NarL/FixJ family response regulator